MAQTTVRRRDVIGGAGAATLVASAAAAQPPTSSAPAPASLDAILADRIDVQKMGVGLALAQVSGEGVAFTTHGLKGGDPDGPVGPDTLFEIGSLTKVFTALVLADAVSRGEVGLDDAANRHLPATLQLPERNGRAITLTDLATHTSGLPKLPANYPPVTDVGAVAHYSQADLAAAMKAQVLARDPGASFEYSNLGYVLLALALAHRAGRAFPALLDERVLRPLGLASTSFAPPARWRARMTHGHDGEFAPAPALPRGPLDGAGALKSSPRDLARFLQAALGDGDGELRPAFALMTATRRPTPSKAVEQGLGWQIAKQSGLETVLKTGDTYGFTALMAFNASSHRGVALVSNAFIDAQDIGLHALYPAYPLRPARHEIALSPALLDRYAGVYDRAGETIAVQRDGERLMLRLPGAPPLRLHAESETRFFVREAPLAFGFVLGPDGRAASLTQPGAPPATRRDAG